MTSNYRYNDLTIVKHKSDYGINLVISLWICLLILMMFIFVSREIWHWFVIPVLCCGVIVSIEAIQWLRKPISLFDPAGVVGLLGVYFFFVAPLLHVTTDYWMKNVIPPSDWRNWLGWMAGLNFISLLGYRFSLNYFSKIFLKKKHSKIWVISEKRFWLIIISLLLLIGCLQMLIYSKFGGISGFITEYELRDKATFQGMGFAFMFTHSFPILSAIAYAVYVHNRKISQSWWTLWVCFLIFLLLKLFFGGLGGSRSNIVWGLFWLVGIVHFWIRPISKVIVLFGLIFLVSFMYIYGFYKGAGLEGIRSVATTESREELSEQTGRTLNAALLSDLARSDVQAFLLYRISEFGFDTEFGYGRTYLGALALLIPRSLWSERPETKVKEGTEVQYGAGSHITTPSSRVYGLAGEAMLNFGPLAVPFFFFCFGFIIAKVRAMIFSFHPDDCRILIIPFLINLCIVILAADSDNLVFFTIKNGFLPISVIFLSSKTVFSDPK